MSQSKERSSSMMPLHHQPPPPRWARFLAVLGLSFACLGGAIVFAVLIETVNKSGGPNWVGELFVLSVAVGLLSLLLLLVARRAIRDANGDLTLVRAGLVIDAIGAAATTMTVLVAGFMNASTPSF
jgi:hypothetical protein